MVFLLKTSFIRFAFGQNEKVSDPVTIGKTMVVQGAEYQFLSSIVHHGTAINNGHYTCVAQCPNNTLTEFDDAVVCTR